MPSIALQLPRIVIESGSSTHKDKHIAVAIDGLGGLIDKPKLAAATPDGYAELQLSGRNHSARFHAFGCRGLRNHLFWRGSRNGILRSSIGHIVHECRKDRTRKGERAPVR